MLDWIAMKRLSLIMFGFVAFAAALVWLGCTVRDKFPKEHVFKDGKRGLIASIDIPHFMGNKLDMIVQMPFHVQEDWQITKIMFDDQKRKQPVFCENAGHAGMTCISGVRIAHASTFIRETTIRTSPDCVID